MQSGKKQFFIYNHYLLNLYAAVISFFYLLGYILNFILYVFTRVLWTTSYTRKT
jgi:hypothetical protein